MYPIELVTPMAAQLNEAGVESLTDAAEVDNIMAKKAGTVLMVVNSVCGCAAANARPGIIEALNNGVLPDERYTVFAGVDREATDRARAYMKPYPPSSPSVALFKDGRLVHMLERHHIEGNSAAAIAANLKGAFDQYCAQ